MRNFCKYHDSIPIVGTKQENVVEKAKAWIKQIEQRRWPMEHLETAALLGLAFAIYFNNETCQYEVFHAADAWFDEKMEAMKQSGLKDVDKFRREKIAQMRANDAANR